MAIQTKADIPYICYAEATEFLELSMKFNPDRTTTGAESFNSFTSGTTYTTADGGEEDIFDQLQVVLEPYNIDAQYLNSIRAEIIKIFDNPEIPIVLSPSTPIVSTTETEFGAPLKGVITGRTIALTNSIKGDFSDLSEWNVLNSTLDNSDAQYIKVINPTGNIFGFYTDSVIELSSPSDKLFVYSKAKAIHGSQTFSRIFMEVDDPDEEIGTVTNPVNNQEYELYGVTTRTDFISPVRAKIYGRTNVTDANAELWVDKEVGVFALNVTQLDAELASEGYTEQEREDVYLSIARNGYFESYFQSTNFVEISTNNKNLFEINKEISVYNPSESGVGIERLDTGIRVFSKTAGTFRTVRMIYQLKPNTSYDMSRIVNVLSGATAAGAGQIFISNIPVPVVFSKTETDTTFITGSDGITYVTFYATHSTTEDGDVEFKDVIINESITDSDYVKNEQSRLSLGNNPLGSSPRGTLDKYDIEADVFLENTNIGRDGSVEHLSGTLTNYINGQGFNNDLSGARLAGVANGALTETLDSGFGYDNLNIYRVIRTTNTLLTEHGIYISPSGFIVIYVPTSLLATDDLAGIQAYFDENQIDIVYELETQSRRKLGINSQALSFADYTQVSVETGKVPKELAKALLSTGYVYINFLNLAAGDTRLKLECDVIENVYFEGKNITGLGTILESPGWDVYGNQGWRIEESVVEENNIDINKIRVDYKTLETNNQASVTGEFNNSLAEAQADEAKKLADVGNNVDEVTARFNDSVGNLGGAGVDDFAITPAGLCSWSNPTSSDFEDVTIYQAKFDISTIDRILLENDDAVTKYVTSGTSQGTLIDPLTDYTYVITPRYAVGGKSYYGRRSIQTLSTPDIATYYDAPDNPGGMVVTGTAVINPEGIVIRQDPTPSIFGTTNTPSAEDLSAYSRIQCDFTKEGSGTTSGFSVICRVVSSIGGTVLASQSITANLSPGDYVLNVDVTAVSTGYIEFVYEGSGDQFFPLKYFMTKLEAHVS